MLPYGFAAMMGLSQTLPAEHCRLEFKESIFHSQMVPVLLPEGTDWLYLHRLYTAPFPSVTWKFSLQYYTGSNCFVTPNY